jgi:hypothetical protein
MTVIEHQLRDEIRELGEQVDRSEEACDVLRAMNVRLSEKNDALARQLQGAVEALRQIAAFEVDPDDGWDYSVGVMRAIAADALDHLGGQ